MAESKQNKCILVTGDPVCDHNYYRGNRSAANAPDMPGFRVTETGGGAFLLKELIATLTDPNVTPNMAGWHAVFGLDVDYKLLPPQHHSFCLWEPQISNPLEEDPDKQVKVWRTADPLLGYGHPVDEEKLENNTLGNKPAIIPLRKQLSATPDIIVIDDAGLDFRKNESESCWPTYDKGTKQPWCVLKLTSTFIENKLLEKMVELYKERLIIVISAEQLRRNGVRISKGLSWEATAEDLSAELDKNHRLAPLLLACHLIVTFGLDGAFWLNNEKPQKSSMLVFDSARAEGEWAEYQGKGNVFGFLSCFTAAIVAELCRESVDNQTPDFETALAAGLAASRTLLERGHGLVEIVGDQTKHEYNKKVGFPFAAIAATILGQDEKEFVSALIPQKPAVKRGEWMMLNEWQVQASSTSEARPHYDAAMAVAVLGPEALERFPVAQFGDYQTVDRKEIESLRTIRQLILNYKNGGKQKTPLNLGVFGPPGSGKSFIVIEIAKAVGIKEENVKIFNLSQFSDASDLFGAFHQVRDMVLKGTTPLIFWDEFDAQGYRWLQYLLAPMEDEVQDGQITHPIGKCIFVFAGATSSTYDKFGPVDPDLIEKKDIELLLENTTRLQEVERAWKDFVLAKGPDFKSRLVGYLNILGANRKLSCDEKAGRRVWCEDATDLCFPIRRALFMRSLFKIKKGSRLELDPQVIKALLEMPKFNGGGRSLQFLCNHLKTSSDKPGRSELPGYELLNMHVNTKEFWKLCEQDMEFAPKAAELAFYLHEAYRLRIKDNPKKNKFDIPLAELPEDMQKANIAQALRFPGILRLAKMHLEKGPVVPIKDLVADREANLAIEKPIREALTATGNKELLSEAEHNGWMVDRMLNGWKYGRKRNDADKIHDDLIPYSQLSEEIKNYDRWTIVGKPASPDNPEQFGYVDMVKVVGLRVVMDSKASAKTA
jgi:hypothetical protein